MKNLYTSHRQLLKRELGVNVKLLLLIAILSTGHIVFSQPVNFSYTGNVQSWTVPPCVNSITITAAGAKGGGGASGGNGAVVTGTFAVTPGQVLQIRVGGTGSCTGTCAGGYNGGGNGDPGTWNSCGGGGSSDVRIAPYGLTNRIIVGAGGGGRAGGTPNTAAGGAGGCANGTPGVGSYGGGGGGGTQATGGAGGNPYAAPGTFGQAGTLGQGGNCGVDNCGSSSSGGGGGGGYYGGGGGGPDCISLTSYIGGGGGGGGSSLIPPGGTCSAGTNTGPNGYVVINYTTGSGITATNTGPYCLGSTIQLNGVGGGTYTWTGPNSFSSSVQNPTIPNATAADAGVYSLTVTAPNCQVTVTTTVVVSPAPPVNAGADQTVCEGTNVTLSGSGANTYTWDNGVTNATAFTPPVGATTTYTVTGTTTQGCTATDQVNVTVNPNPLPVISGNATYCSGFPTTLSTTLPYAGYNWSTSVTTATTSATQVNSPVTVTVTDINNCQATSAPFVVTELQTINTTSTAEICQGESIILHGIAQTVAGDYTGNFVSVQGCDSISVVTLTVNPLPIIDAGLDQEVCENTPTTLSASGALTYTWDNSVTNGVAFTQNVGTVTYTVTGTDANGCENTDQVDIVMNPFPVVDAGPNQAICTGDATSVSGGGAVTYTWDNGVTDGVSFNPTVSMTYTVTGTDANGCIDTDQMTITVNNLPNVFAGADQSICDGQSTTVSGTGAVTYTWDNGITNGAPFTPVLGTTTYTVTGTDANGCIDTDDLNINVIPAPVVNFTSDVTEGCVPLEVNFTNTGDQGTDCIWTMSDGTTLNGCNTVTYTFDEIDCHDISLQVTNSTGCVTTLTINDIVCTEDGPDVNFIVTPSMIGPYNSTVNFLNNTTGGVSYAWDFGDGSAVSNAVEPSHIYDAETVSNYQVALTAYSPLGCESTAYGVVQYVEETIYYIPNTFTPDGDMFNQTFQPIFTSGFDPFNYSLYIYNRWGELIFESHNATIGWDGTYNGELVQDGMYLWKVEFKPKNDDNKFIDSGHVTIIR